MVRNKGHVPVRTCISCRAKRGKKDMIRLTLNSHGVLVRDVSGKGQGRGAYVCPKKICWEKPGLWKRFEGAFRKTGHLDFHPEFRFELGAFTKDCLLTS